MIQNDNVVVCKVPGRLGIGGETAAVLNLEEHDSDFEVVANQNMQKVKKQERALKPNKPNKRIIHTSASELFHFNNSNYMK